MSCQNCWKKLLPFGLALILGVFAVNIMERNNSLKINKIESAYKVDYQIEKGGSGVSGACFRINRPKQLSVCINEYATACNKSSELKKDKPFVDKATALIIVSKPKANYTDTARQNNIQGTVTLRVTFLANGSIGSMSIVSGLPDGLTEQALASAREMKFEPAKRNGIPYTVTRLVQYNFTLY